jgi:hypothetical protein
MRFSGSKNINSSDINNSIGIHGSIRQDLKVHSGNEFHDFNLSIEKFKKGPEALQANALLNLIHSSSSSALQFFREELKTPNTPSNKLILDALSSFPTVRHLVIRDTLESLAMIDNPNPQIYLSCMENLAECGALGLDTGYKQFPLIEKLNLDQSVKEAGAIKLAESMPTVLIAIILNRDSSGLYLSPLEQTVLQNWQSIANSTIRKRLAEVKSKDSVLKLLVCLNQLNSDPVLFSDLTKNLEFKLRDLKYPKTQLAIAKFLALVGNKKPLERIKKEIALDAEIRQVLEA